MYYYTPELTILARPSWIVCRRFNIRISDYSLGEYISDVGLYHCGHWPSYSYAEDLVSCWSTAHARLHPDVSCPEQPTPLVASSAPPASCMSQRHIARCPHPLFLLPWWFQVQACLVILLFGFLKVWPRRPDLLLRMSICIWTWLVLSQRLLMHLLSRHCIPKRLAGTD